MIYVYNNEGLHDTLLCIATKRTDAVIETIEKDAAVVLMQNQEIIGYNILNASTKLDIKFTGLLLEDEPAFNKQIALLLTNADIALPNIEAEIKQQFIIGSVEQKQKHPDSDKLSICQVDLKGEVLQIVCGAQNIEQGQKVVVAKIGSMMPTGLLIEPSILRKVASNGMICSGKELNLAAEFNNKGILVLPSTAPVGTGFYEYFKKEMI
ncbi:tRNA-binding protein [Erysipelotrichaceae bacterium]|nr:tRNA-binding protein [Erysipelotrichaceae bacterium]